MMVDIPVGKVGLIYGKKGSGKSLYLARIAKRAAAEGRYVFSFSEEAGTLPLPSRYWEYEYPRGSVLLIDEVATIHRSRDFKTFPKECGTWYKMIRKMALTVYLTSQIDDVDKTIRSLADFVLVLGGSVGPFQRGVWYKTSLIVAPKVDEDGVAIGAAEIDMGLTEYGSKWRSMYFQYGKLYWRLTDTYRLFDTYKPVSEVVDLPALPEGRPCRGSKLNKIKILLLRLWVKFRVTKVGRKLFGSPPRKVVQRAKVSASRS